MSKILLLLTFFYFIFNLFTYRSPFILEYCTWFFDYINEIEPIVYSGISWNNSRVRVIFLLQFNDRQMFFFQCENTILWKTSYPHQILDFPILAWGSCCITFVTNSSYMCQLCPNMPIKHPSVIYFLQNVMSKDKKLSCVNGF